MATYKLKNKFQKDHSVKYKVLSDCIYAMWIPIFLNLVSQIAEEILLIFTADVLGDFADVALNLKFDLGIRKVVILAICVLTTVLIIPIIGLLSDFVMLRKSINHDVLIFERYLDKDLAKAEKLDSGKIQYELEDAPNTLRIKLVAVIGNVVALPIGLGYLLYNSGKISWILTGVMFFLVALRLIVPTLLRKKMAVYDVDTKAYQALRRSYEMDITTRPVILRLWGIGKSIIQRVNQLYLTYHSKTETNYISYQTLIQQFENFFDNFAKVLLFVIGAIMVSNNSVTPGQLTAILVYLSITQTLLSYISNIIQDCPLIKNALNRVCLFYQDTEETLGEKINDFDGLKSTDLGISFENKHVFSNLSFKISPGDKVCFVGKNGCGKSTLCKIITTSIKNYSGILCVGDVDIKSVNIENYRSLFAYAPQVPYLFEATVRENIAMGNPLASSDQIDDLMKMFHILPLANKEISSKHELSGGERQKISVARALLKNSPLLILDEPTNHMDSESVYSLIQYIKETDKTVILISHNPEIQEIARVIEV